jgi:cell wall-associated NlpC family hydrolase
LFLLLTVSVLTGCASTPSDDKSAWLDPQGRRTVDLSGVPGINPITAIAASQHPLTREALQQIGVKYRYGGTSPDRGFDCSGLIHYSAQESWGLKLPRRTRDMAQVGQKLKISELVVGDLVFFNTLGHRYSHVGIYLGDGYFVHAPSSGGQVRVDNMSVQYWKKRYTGARRIEPVRLAKTN